MVDFSKLKRPSVPTERDPFAFDDQHLFAGKKIHRGVIDLTWDRRATMSSDKTVVGLTEKGQTIGVIFSGHRSELFEEGLSALLDARWSALCEAWMRGAITSLPGEREVAIRVIVEGAWKPRFWKDRDGVQHKAWDLIVARWHYAPDAEKPETFVEEGRLPQAA